MEAETGGLEELTDEEMAALGKEELVRRLRREEAARLAARGSAAASCRR